MPSSKCSCGQLWANRCGQKETGTLIEQSKASPSNIADVPVHEAGEVIVGGGKEEGGRWKEEVDGDGSNPSVSAFYRFPGG